MWLTLALIMIEIHHLPTTRPHPLSRGEIFPICCVTKPEGLVKLILLRRYLSNVLHSRVLLERGYQRFASSARPCRDRRDLLT